MLVLYLEINIIIIIIWAVACLDSLEMGPEATPAENHLSKWSQCVQCT